MRIKLSLLFFLLLLVSTAYAQNQTTYYITTSAGARARECATSLSTCDIVTVFRYGTAITVVGEVEGISVSGERTWLEVEYEDETVYVHSTLASTRAPSTSNNSRSTTSSNSNRNTSGNISSNTVAATAQPPISTPVPQAPPPMGASCPNPSATCSALTCEQAYACLAAGNGRLDRDNDGVPCESVCPGG